MKEIASTILLFTLSHAFGPFQNQHGYRLLAERADAESYNKDYVYLSRFYVSRFNRTTKGVNMRIGINVNLTAHDTMATVHTYKFLSNEYRPFPLTFTTNACECFKKDNFDVQSRKKNGNVTDCPILEGYYYFNNWIPDSTKFPPNIPYI